jgi:hypothetical protein
MVVSRLNDLNKPAGMLRHRDAKASKRAIAQGVKLQTSAVHYES